MILRPVLVAPPAEGPVALDAFKAHLHITWDDDDARLQALLDGAVAYLDGPRGILGRCMVTQTWAVHPTAWSDAFRLPFPEVSSVAISYVDANGDDVDLAVEAVELVADYQGVRAVIAPGVTAPDLSSERAAPIEVAFATGFGDESQVPANLKTAIMLLAGSWSRHPEGMIDGQASALPVSVEALVRPFRWRSL